MSHSVNDRVGETDAVGVELRHEVRHYPFAVLLESVRSGEKGSGMTILAHSQEEKVMPVKALTSGALPQLVFVFLGSDRWICLAPNSKNVFRGNWGVIKKRFLRHAVVALIAVGRNTAFIAET